MRSRLAGLGENILTKFDANETAFLEKQLEEVETQTYDVQYSILKSKEFIPFDESIPEWADTWVYRSWSRSGVAELVAKYGDDLPRVDVGVEETTHKTAHYGVAYGYNVDEIEKSAKLSEPLDSMRGVAAREEMDVKIDEHAAMGEPLKGVKGFLNNTAVPLVTVTNGDWLDVTTTADQILADLFEIENAVIDQSGEHHKPTDMVMPGAYYSKLKTMKIGTASDTTVLEYFLAHSESVKTISRWARTATAGSGGIPMILCYTKNPQCVRYRLSYPWKQLEPEKRNLEYVIACLSKLGGVVWYRPLSAVRVTGIDA